MDRVFLILGAVLAAISVALGAFAAHGLQNRVDDALIDVFQTGARYQMIHAIGLFLVGLLMRLFSPNAWFLLAGWLMVAGIILFSGSLYLLVFTGVRQWGAITPLGGVAFILAWVCLAVAIGRAWL